MNKTGIRKVKILQGMAKALAEAEGLEPDDLVILTVSLEKVIGDPFSYLLAQIEDDEVQTSAVYGGYRMKPSVKLLSLALEIDNLCEDVGYDFNEYFDPQFGEIIREIEDLEFRISDVTQSTNQTARNDKK